jgi:hypothetical protein
MIYWNGEIALSYKQYIEFNEYNYIIIYNDNHYLITSA